MWSLGAGSRMRYGANVITAVHSFYVQLVDCGARCNGSHCVRGGVHDADKWLVCRHCQFVVRVLVHFGRGGAASQKR